jgi:hypothetical protein
LRVQRAGNFTRGLEWADARHGADGSLILSKAVWASGAESGKLNSIGVADVNFDQLGTLIGAGGDGEPALLVARIDQNTWMVELNLSDIRSKLDERWQKTDSSDVNLRLSLIHAYARWGFNDVAAEKYRELAKRVESGTQDTILSKELNPFTLSTQDRAYWQLVIAALRFGLLEGTKDGSISANQVLIRVRRIEKLAADLPADMSSDLWRLQAEVCEAASHARRITVAQRKNFLEMQARYLKVAIRSQFLAKGLPNPWEPTK